jgi:hypothetical protein
MNRYAIACDVGRKRDRYTEMVFEDCPRAVDGVPALGSPARVVHTYGIVWLKSLINPTYDDMIDSAATLAERPELVRNADLLVDGNGVGDAVVEGLRKRKLFPVPIIATGGVKVNEEFDDPFGSTFGSTEERTQAIRSLKQLNVPKSHLVTAGIVLLEQRRVGLTDGLPEGELKSFVEQLEAFREERNKRTRRVTWNAADDEVHDDFVSCFLMLAWWTARTRGSIPERVLRDNPRGTTWKTEQPLSVFSGSRGAFYE